MTIEQLLEKLTKIIYNTPEFQADYSDIENMIESGKRLDNALHEMYAMIVDYEKQAGGKS